MATFPHLNDRRKQRCHFCGERLKNYRDVEAQTRTGYRFHIWCKQAIAELKKRQGAPDVRNMFISQNFVECIYEKSRQLLVYA